MVAHVCERARASGAKSVTVATDDERIRQAVEAAGHRALMTRADHPSGTDRIAEAAAALGLSDDAIVVNVQGDEPLIAPALIADVAGALGRDTEASMSTACHAIHDEASLANPNVVKVVLDNEGYAHYFSRAPIPWARDAFGGIPLEALPKRLPDGLPALRHIGIYAYRVRFLQEYARLTPTAAEQLEALEQLRALGHGHRIAVALWNGSTEAGVDTAEDLARVRKALSRR